MRDLFNELMQELEEIPDDKDDDYHEIPGFLSVQKITPGEKGAALILLEVSKDEEKEEWFPKSQLATAGNELFATKWILGKKELL